MARYEREILVPYLYDVCCAEFLCRKLKAQIQSYDDIIRSNSRLMEQPIVTPTPPMKAEKREIKLGEIVALMASVVLICFAMLKCFPFTVTSSLLDGFASIVHFIGFVCIVVAVIIGFVVISNIRTDNRNAKLRYEQEIRDYPILQKKYEEEKIRKGQYFAAYNTATKLKSEYQHKLDHALWLRSNLYNVNIIPARYRNIYAVYYLYDYFRTSQEDDLDKIIQTLLLDEIKQKLDKIIMQNEQILLNQRIQQAMIEKQNQQLTEQHNTKMKELAVLEQNQQLQNEYLSMINNHVRFTAFLTATDFIEKHS